MKQTDPALAQAVEWMVLLRSGHAGTREKAAFESWRTEDPAHGAACERVAGAFGSFDKLRERGVSASVAHQAVQGLSRRSVMYATFSASYLSSMSSMRDPFAWCVCPSTMLHSLQLNDCEICESQSG